jgi:hypothetical protein
MAKKGKNGNHRKRQLTVPLAVVGGFAVPITKMYQGFRGEGLTGALNEAIKGFIGYRPTAKTWDFMCLKDGLLPVVVGITVHKMASALGVNRMLASTGIPILRI